MNWKSINHRTKVCWEAMGKCSRAATAQRCYLECEEGDCVYACVSLACPCSEWLFVLGGGLEGVCVCAVRGLGRCAWRSPRRPDSPPVPLQFPERIVFFLSEEERPAHREMGPKVGKVMKEISKCNEFKHSSVSLTEKKVYAYKRCSLCFINSKWK